MSVGRSWSVISYLGKLAKLDGGDLVGCDQDAAGILDWRPFAALGDPKDGFDIQISILG